MSSPHTTAELTAAQALLSLSCTQNTVTINANMNTSQDDKDAARALLAMHHSGRSSEEENAARALLAMRNTEHSNEEKEVAKAMLEMRKAGN
jgi:hypothetical protein